MRMKNGILCILLLCCMFALCACGERENRVIYNGRELSESEIQDMLHRETERDAKAGAVLIAYDTQMATPSDDSVYWTSGGGVFHAKVSCRHLSGKTVYYGTVEDAVTEGKLRACSVCAQK